MTFKRELESHLKQWKVHLIKVQSPKELWVPDRFSVGPVPREPRGQRHALQEPICLASLPLGNANSRKERRIWAFIDGFFDVYPGDDGKEYLRNFGAAVTFFEAKPRARRFRLVDAYHFDFHMQANSKSAPHPLYHSQRDVHWDPDRWRTALNAGSFGDSVEFNFPEFHSGVRSVLFKLSRVRVPTARIDLFGLILSTTADMLIKHDVDGHREAFDEMVGLIDAAVSPLTKLRRDEPYLPDCYPAARSSISGWYPLFSRLPGEA